MADSLNAEPHPLELLRQEAKTTTTAQVRRTLDTLSDWHFGLLDPHGWSAGAEETLRAAIGMERKAQMEMRIGLGADADPLPIRKTGALGDMTLPDLLVEYRENRAMTLAVLDLMLDVSTRREVRAWTLGEEVPPEIHILSLRNRLEMLGKKVAEQKVG